MKKLLNFLFGKINLPHICNYKCTGYVSHFGQVSEIKNGVINPSWYHYPSIDLRKSWIKKGFIYARVFQSHWKCSCGETQTHFFLSNPSSGYLDKIVETISIKEWNEMIQANPIILGSNRGQSLSEVTNDLIKEFC